MNSIAAESYGTPISRDTIRFERVLPGPIERVWTYLTDSEKRGKWLASGTMELRVGGAVHLVFKNDDLSSPPSFPNAKYASMRGCAVPLAGRITRYEAPTLLAFTWGESEAPSEVEFRLVPVKGEVKLTLTHTRLPNRDEALSVSGGWHTHLGILIDQLSGRAPRPFWPEHARLESEYEERLPPAS